MDSHVYGPVPSRRLGQSLGVSPIPHKTCTYTCTYCQLGRTTELTLRRRRYFPPEEALAEVERALEAGGVDHVTIVGDGEPTLSLDLGLLVRGIKERWNVPVAVITNGSLLWNPGVREDLREADVVLPTLSAGSEDVWRRLHLPHRQLTFKRVHRGLVEFSETYGGQIWLEVMLVGDLNDTDEALADLRAAIDGVRHDRMDILVPTRPTTRSWTGPPPPDRLLRAQEVLGSGRTLTREADGSFDVRGYGDAEQALVDIGSRHPLRERDAIAICEKFGDTETLERMAGLGELVRVEHSGQAFLMPAHLMLRRGTGDTEDE